MPKLILLTLQIVRFHYVVTAVPPLINSYSLPTDNHGWTASKTRSLLWYQSSIHENPIRCRSPRTSDDFKGAAQTINRPSHSPLHRQLFFWGAAVCGNVVRKLAVLSRCGESPSRRAQEIKATHF